jgi:hypothetical protein
MEVPCVNLRERFGRRYKVTFEESYAAAYGPKASRDDPWLQIIPGALGHVFPHSATMLGAKPGRSGKSARRLKDLPFVQVHTDGSDGVTVLFSPNHLNLVADLLQLRRRRRVSDRERQRLAALGRKYGFQPRQAGFQTSSEARESTIGPKVDLGEPFPGKPGTKKPAGTWKRFQTIAAMVTTACCLQAGTRAGLPTPGWSLCR